ncbi:mCG146019, partial [Mus musculus]
RVETTSVEEKTGPRDCSKLLFVTGKVMDLDNGQSFAHLSPKWEKVTGPQRPNQGQPKSGSLAPNLQLTWGKLAQHSDPSCPISC